MRHDALVHLTWRQGIEVDTRWPGVRFDGPFAEFVAQARESEPPDPDDEDDRDDSERYL